MMKVPLFVLSFLMFGFTACESVTHPVDELVGCFVYDYYQKDAGFWVYSRENKLKDDAPGLCFKEDGKLIVRQNAGWCGTPPISYANFDGTWVRTDNNVVIVSGYWGGELEYDFDIIELTSDSLTIDIHY